MGVCHFPSFYEAMDAAQHIVPLDPVAVELVDDTMIQLARKKLSTIRDQTQSQTKLEMLGTTENSNIESIRIRKCN